MTNTESTTNFMFWAMNECVPMVQSEQLPWFQEVFGEGLGMHFHNKWATKDGFKTSSEKMLMWFFFQLSDSNKERLLEWVEQNHTN